MSYLTLAQARQALWRYSPGSNGTAVPYESRTAADSLAVDTSINLTIERFLTLGKWRGDTVRARFKAFDNQITLPSNLACILGATPIRDVDEDEDNVGVIPYDIYSMYHEFLKSGPGNPSSERLFGLVDLGDNFATFLDPSGTFYLKAYSSSSEGITITGNTLANPTVVTTAVAHGLNTGASITISGSNSTPTIDGTHTITRLSDTTFSVAVNVTVPGTTGSIAKTILFKGLDASGSQIYTTGVEGVPISLTTNPGATTIQQFTMISSWQKSATTTGVVRIYAVDTTTTEETLLVVIPPGKTLSGYHRYRLPDSDWGDTVECLCKRAYVPAVADNDLIIPGHLGALKLGMMSLQYEDRNDMKNADIYMDRAIELLNAELEQFQGDSILPSVQFQRHFGASPIPNLL